MLCFLNLVLKFCSFEFSPCVQGCVSFLFKIPTQSFPDIASMLFSFQEMRHALPFNQALIYCAVVSFASLCITHDAALRSSISTPIGRSFNCCHLYACYNCCHLYAALIAFGENKQNNEKHVYAHRDVQSLVSSQSSLRIG